MLFLAETNVMSIGQQEPQTSPVQTIKVPTDNVDLAEQVMKLVAEHKLKLQFGVNRQFILDGKKHRIQGQALSSKHPEKIDYVATHDKIVLHTFHAHKFAPGKSLYNKWTYTVETEETLTEKTTRSDPYHIIYSNVLTSFFIEVGIVPAITKDITDEILTRFDDRISRKLNKVDQYIHSTLRHLADTISEKKRGLSDDKHLDVADKLYNTFLDRIKERI